MENFKPLRDCVLVKRREKETKTSGGIILSNPQESKVGEIVEVGVGRTNENGAPIPICLRVGDNVLFTKWSGTSVTINGEELMVMKENDIIGVFDE